MLVVVAQGRICMSILYIWANVIHSRRQICYHRQATNSLWHLYMKCKGIHCFIVCSTGDMKDKINNPKIALISIVDIV